MANHKRTVFNIESAYGNKSIKLYLEDDGKYWITCCDDYENFHMQVETSDITVMFKDLEKEHEIIVREHNSRTIQISTHEFRNRFPKRVAAGFGLKETINGNAVQVYEVTKETCIKLGITSEEFETRFGVPNV